MSRADEKLASVAEQLKRGVAPQPETVRSFLLWFYAERRGYRVVHRIRNALRRHGLITFPDFEWVYIDGLISFQKAPPEGAPQQAVAGDSAPDPSYRIGRLTSANRAPVSVSPDSPLQQVVTLMMSNDFSQLPVVTGPRDLKGAVSWKTIGTRLALKRPCLHARDCMGDAKVVTLEESLFTAISIIAIHDYVLIQAADKTICGIVTASDVNDQFRILAEPFLLVGEIENGIRRLIHGKFTVNELDAAKAPGDATSFGNASAGRTEHSLVDGLRFRSAGAGPSISDPQHRGRLHQRVCRSGCGLLDRGKASGAHSGRAG